MRTEEPCNAENKDTIIFQSGKMYFRRSTERRAYFLLTVAVATLGILAKIGLL